MSKNILEWSPLLVQPNKFQLDSERKDMGKSTMFNVTYCTIIKVPDKFSAGWTNKDMVEQTNTNLILSLSVRST